MLSEERCRWLPIPGMCRICKRHDGRSPLDSGRAPSHFCGMAKADPLNLKRMVCAALCALLLGATPARADDDGDADAGSPGSGSAAGGPGAGGEGVGALSARGAPGSGSFLADLRSFGRALTGVQRGGEGNLASDIVASGIDAQASARLRAAGFGVIAQRQGTLVPGSVARLSPPAGTSMANALAQARALAPAARFDRNDLYRTQAAGCQGPQCFHLVQVGWTRTAPCRAPARIGMIDTGITLDHPALAGARIRADVLRAPDRAPSASAHGTAVAALLVGAPGGPLPGLLPGAELFAIDAFHRGQGGDAADAFDLAGALDQLVARRVAVINLSFAGPDNAVLEAATRAAAARGVVLTAAAGNGGPKAARAFPAAYDWVVAVTAVDREAKPYVRAVQGTHLDFAAPGVGLPAPDGRRGLSGTSFAVPFVTAAYALALPREPAAAATRRLTRGAQDLGRPGHDDVFGHGLIQPQAACPN